MTPRPAARPIASSRHPRKRIVVPRAAHGRNGQRWDAPGEDPAPRSGEEGQSRIVQGPMMRVPR